MAAAQQLKGKATTVFQDAGFNLHKWHSNDKVLEGDQTDEVESTYAKQQLGTPGGENSSLLGLKWNKDKDTLTVPMALTRTVLTKRGILGLQEFMIH